MCERCNDLEHAAQASYEYWQTERDLREAAEAELQALRSVSVSEARLVAIAQLIDEAEGLEFWEWRGLVARIRAMVG